MLSSYFNVKLGTMLRILTNYATRRFPGPEGHAWLDVLSTDQVREVRTSLLNLAYCLIDHPETDFAFCVVGLGKSSTKRLQQEIASFRRAVRKEVADRIFLLDLGLQPLDGRYPEDDALIAELTKEVELAPAKLRLTRHSVVAYVVNAWIRGEPPQGVTQLVNITGASYQTVQGAFDELKSLGVVKVDAYPKVQLRPPRWEDWRRLCEWRDSDRKSYHFFDPTSVARGPARLFERLSSLATSGKLGDVRISGVLGASRISARDLNITAAPRLDLCVFDGDTSFVRLLDAALVPLEEGKGTPSLVVHQVRRTAADTVEAARQVNTASALDCLTDILQMGYQLEAQEFAQTLSQRSAALHSI